MEIKRVEEIAKQVAETEGPVLLIGNRGSGKVMVARRVTKYLPPLDAEVVRESEAIMRFRGIGPFQCFERPFRAPHHTISYAGMYGLPPDSTAIPQFGEVTLAHGGLLFLDDLDEFAFSAIETLYVVMATGEVRFNKKTLRISYPAKFKLLCAINRCPCGDFPDCNCTAEIVEHHVNRCHQMIGPMTVIYL